MPKITRHGGASNAMDEDEVVQVLYGGRTYSVRRGDLKDPKSENDREFFEELRRSSGKFDGEERPENDEEATEDTGSTETEGADDSEPQEDSEGAEEGDDESVGNNSSPSSERTSESDKKTLKQSQSHAQTTGHRSKKLRKA